MTAPLDKWFALSILVTPSLLTCISRLLDSATEARVGGKIAGIKYWETGLGGRGWLMGTVGSDFEASVQGMEGSGRGRSIWGRGGRFDGVFGRGPL